MHADETNRSIEGVVLGREARNEARRAHTSCSQPSCRSTCLAALSLSTLCSTLVSSSLIYLWQVTLRLGIRPLQRLDCERKMFASSISQRCDAPATRAPCSTRTIAWFVSCSLDSSVGMLICAQTLPLKDAVVPEIEVRTVV